MTTNRSERAEGVVLVVILLLVAGFAGAASFTHVKEWTMRNSPPGTGAWFGWANAVISELIPGAALLTIRRRRRTGGSIGYPMFLLVCAVLLSLSAQLAVAKPGLSGWLLSAVPALAFLGLSKLVLSTKPTIAPTGDAPDEPGSARPAENLPATIIPAVPPAASTPAAPLTASASSGSERERPGLVPVTAVAFARTTNNTSPPAVEARR